MAACFFGLSLVGDASMITIVGVGGVGAGLFLGLCPLAMAAGARADGVALGLSLV